MKIGLVGKPNVGKSTMFAALTQINVEIANYPFTTIDPNVGITLIPARHNCPTRFLREKFENTGRQSEMIECTPRTGSCQDNVRLIPVTLVDVAGLVPGAHEGKGRGNQFLADLSQCDALIQVIDASCLTDLDGNPIGTGACDPIEEHEFLISELASWILSIINQGWARGVRRAQSDGDKGLISYLYNTLNGIGAKENQINLGFNKFKLNEDTTNPWDWDENKKHRLALNLREEIFPLYVAANKADIATKSDLNKLIEYLVSGLQKALYTDNHIYLVSHAATGLWEMGLKNCTKKGVLHIVNGAFSSKWSTIPNKCGLMNEVIRII